MIWPFNCRSRSTSPLFEVDAASIVKRARRMRFRVKSGVLSGLTGAYHSARPGIGLTFAELRVYEPGDDVRYIDWSATARQGRPYVRRFFEERSLTVWLIVDVSASLRFGPAGASKADRVAQAAALLATAAVQNGDRVALALVSDHVEVEVVPASGDRHLARLIRALVATPTSSRKSDVTAGLVRLKRSARRALVIVLSDFLTTEPLPSGVWRRAARRHEVIALRAIDSREEALPNVGLIAVEDSESGVSRLVNTGSSSVRAHYSREALNRRAVFRQWCAATGVAGFDLPTALDPIGPLIRIFNDRAARRGRL